MKNALKKITAFFLIMIMLFGSAPLAGLDLFGVEASAEDYQVGDIIEFGSYPQRAITDSYLQAKIAEQEFDNLGRAFYEGDLVYREGSEFYYCDPIEWRVLSVDEDEVYIVAEKLLDCKPYNTSDTSVTWETCTLRTWLNDDFYNLAFNSTEKAVINSTHLVNGDNPYHGTDGGKDTIDKVFVLSLEDALNPDYGFSSNSTRIAYPTEYAKARSVYVDSSNDASSWWLRALGSNSKNACRVFYDGSVIDRGCSIGYSGNGVRPALMLNLNPQIFTVTWNVDGVETVVDYEYGANIVKPSDPIKEGYAFKGWNAEIPSTMPANDLIFTATWEANTYQVTWIVDGVEDVVNYQYGATVVKPSDPSKEGYTFTGWSADIPNIMPANNLTFTAIWEVNTYKVKWIVDGIETVVDYEYGANIVKPSDPAKEGYTFKGWNAEIPSTMPANDLIFTATWEANTYQVTWNVDGVEDVVNYQYGATVVKPSDPSKEGYTFTGWSADIPNTMPANDLIFTASWNVNTYQVTWIVGGTEIAVNYEYGTNIIMPSDPIKEGYTFKGWSTNIPSTMPANNLTFTAMWDVNSYNVTWIVDGVEDVVDYEYGEAIVKPSDPTKEGYTFTGWGADIPYTVPAKDLTFTAIWEANIYKVKWIVDGVKIDINYEYGEAIVKPSNPTKEGYTFKGWNSEIPSTMPAENLTFTAVFELIPVITPTIKINNNPGTRTINYGEGIKFTATATDMPEGAQIKWYVNGAEKGTGTTFTFSNASADTTITVKVVDKNGNVLKDATDGEISESEKITVNAGFFQKLISFFKNLFKINRIIAQSIDSKNAY